jgi:hypothetical protein
MADAEKLSPVSTMAPLVRARRAAVTCALALTATTIVQVSLPGGAIAADAPTVSSAPSGARKQPPAELRRLDYFRGTWI